MKIFQVVIAVLLLNSCQVYRTQFDCPVGKGVPCTPVTEIEQMIVETPEGSPDIFLGYLPKNNCSSSCKEAQALKIWIPDREDPPGLITEGHYIYLKRELS